MTTIHSVADNGSIGDATDLPLPGAGSAETSRNTASGIPLPRPVTSGDIADSGRIRFGNAYRMPVAR